MSNKNIDIIESIRKRFLSDVGENPGLYHEIDIERVKTDNWQIERYILDTDTEEDAYKLLTKSLEWKNSFGVHKHNDNYFPKEFYLIFGFEKYSKDKEGRVVTFHQLKDYKKVSDMSHLFQQFLAHQMEKLDTEAGKRGWISVNDCAGTGMTNVDMSLSQFRVELLNYYPQGMKLSLNVDMPWLMNSVFKLVKNFMNRKIRDNVIVIKREQLIDYIDIDLLPKSFGGNREFINDIEKYQSLQQLNYLDINDKQLYLDIENHFSDNTRFSES